MIGIIVAEDKELDEVLKITSDVTKDIYYNNIFYLGKMCNKTVVIVKGNVGKVNAARICQLLIDKYSISFIINMGVAGSVNNLLEIGDIVIAKRLYQYDFDVTVFGRKKGEIENIGPCIEINNKEISLFDGLNVKIGTVITGDKFVVDNDEKELLHNEFNADCVEMEGASIAQVCYLDKIPFVIIKAISDKKDGSSKIEFNTFLSESSKKATMIIKSIINKI